MWVKFTTFYDKPIVININKIVYYYESEPGTTWIVFGANDFELRVKHPYSYVMQQLANVQAGG